MWRVEAYDKSSSRDVCDALLVVDATEDLTH
jgi:hypothetical protein